jgi:hypothetical protein
MLQYLVFPLFILFAYLFAKCLLSILMTYTEWKYYPKVYKELSNKTWTREYVGIKGTQSGESDFF